MLQGPAQARHRIVQAKPAGDSLEPRACRAETVALAMRTQITPWMEERRKARHTRFSRLVPLNRKLPML